MRHSRTLDLEKNSTGITSNLMSESSPSPTLLRKRKQEIKNGCEVFFFTFFKQEGKCNQETGARNQSLKVGSVAFGLLMHLAGGGRSLEIRRRYHEVLGHLSVITCK